MLPAKLVGNIGVGEQGFSATLVLHTQRFAAVLIPLKAVQPGNVLVLNAQVYPSTSLLSNGR